MGVRLKQLWVVSSSSTGVQVWINCELSQRNCHLTLPQPYPSEQQQQHCSCPLPNAYCCWLLPWWDPACWVHPMLLIQACCRLHHHEVCEDDGNLSYTLHMIGAGQKPHLEAKSWSVMISVHNVSVLHGPRLEGWAEIFDWNCHVKRPHQTAVKSAMWLLPNTSPDLHEWKHFFECCLWTGRYEWLLWETRNMSSSLLNTNRRKNNPYFSIIMGSHIFLHHLATDNNIF